jgi:hypothetical protein
MMIVASEFPAVAVLAGLSIGGVATWEGIQTWRGVESGSIRRAEARDQPHGLGGRRQYGTLLGTGLSGLIGGPGFLLLTLAIAARGALGKPDDWWFFSVVAYTGLALIMVAFVYLVVYQWFGVPDALRPPAQRGQPWPGRRRQGRHGRGGLR